MKVPPLVYMTLYRLTDPSLHYQKDKSLPERAYSLNVGRDCRERGRKAMANERQRRKADEWEICK